MLTDRYLDGIPEDSRAAAGRVPGRELLTEEKLDKVRALNEIAQGRGQSLAQMAIAWVLRDPRVTSALIGARTVAQLDDSLGALDNLDFTDDELAEIDKHAVEPASTSGPPRARTKPAASRSRAARRGS